MLTNAINSKARPNPAANTIIPVGVPFKGLNTRSPYGSMEPNFAIALNNVIVESVGLRTRKGYTEWATNFPTATPVATILNYYPASFDAASQPSGTNQFVYSDMAKIPVVSPRSNLGPGPGKIFAAQDFSIYNVTAGGVGPWVAEAGVTGLGPYWNGVNYQNVGGSFLLICNELGGYAIYNGTSWTMPTLGTGVGQISGIDPADIVWVTTWKERVWFLKKNSTRAYYLPPGQITGVATEFDFGNQMDHGGQATWIGGWTIDGGVGIDDYMVCIGSQGDVIIYKGSDPDSIATFELYGTWYSGPLPAGRRCVESSGGDIHILTQFGILPISKLLQPSMLAAQFQEHLTVNIDPLVAALMRDYSTLPGWQVVTVAKEELVLIRVPELLGSNIAKSFLAYKTTTKTWSVLSNLPYAHIVNAGSLAYAGTIDGRVVRAFDGNLDSVGLITPTGYGIKCRVTPAYDQLGAPGYNKHLKMVRPYFLSVIQPTITFTVLSDFELPKFTLVPSLPAELLGGVWNVGKWDVALWGGSLNPIHSWFGAQGVGAVITVQLDYETGGDTLLTGLDYWVGKGGVM